MDKQIGIIGGGMMGLATAFYLAKAGMTVTVLEREREIGGLSRSQEVIPGLNWDRFYHVILSTDDELLGFLAEMGLAVDVHFRETRTGFFTDGRLHSMSSTAEFLRFKPLSLWNKFRLGAGILYASRLNNLGRLEKTYAKAWLIRVFGRRNYEKLWDPLLRSKLGSAKTTASAAFIWACITRYYGTRHESAKKEMLGCVDGGYHSILERVRDRLLAHGVKILPEHGVVRLVPSPNGGISVQCVGGKEFDFERVVVTVPSPELIRLCPDIPQTFREDLEKVRYLSLVCATLLLRRSLSPFYVTNLTDPGFPFTGLIEATNILPRELLGERGLVYLPRYMPPDDDFMKKSDHEVLDVFFSGLKRIFPDFSAQDLIVSHVYRERYVQPIQDVGYLEKIPQMLTPLARIYLVNTTMISNSTLNNNEVIKLARKMKDLLLDNERKTGEDVRWLKAEC
jgi:protoporphyrinogen oxidase